MKFLFTLIALLFVQLIFAHDSIKSNQYILPNFTLGTIYYKEGSAVKLELNYNLLTDEMQYINEKEKKQRVNEIERIEYLSIGMLRFIPLDGDFGEILVDGEEISLAMKRYTKTSGISRSKANKIIEKGEALSEKAVLIPDTTYHLIRMIEPKGWSLAQDRVVDASRKGFLKVYSDFKIKINEFIDNEDIDFTKPTDIIRLTEFCNKLHLTPPESKLSSK